MEADEGGYLLAQTPAPQIRLACNGPTPSIGLGSCPRERPEAYPSGRRVYLKRRSNPLTFALQT